MSKYIPAYEYAKKYNVALQNVYRWIREGKLDAQKEEITTTRWRINESINPPKGRPDHDYKEYQQK